MKTPLLPLLLLGCFCLSPAARAQRPRLVVQAAHTQPVHAVAFSPDGKVVATASGDQTVKLWHASTGHQLHTLSGHDGAVFALAFNPEGKSLACTGQDGKVWVREVATGRAVYPPFEEKLGRLHALAWSGDGKLLAAAGEGSLVSLHDAASGAYLESLRGHKGGIACLAFSPKGPTLASGGGSRDPSIHLWNGQTRNELRMLAGHPGSVHAVAFSPDGKVLASGGADATAKLWRVATGELLHTLKGHTGPVHGVAFSPDGKTLLSGGEDHTIHFWDTTTGEAAGPVRKVAEEIHMLALSPDGTQLAAAGKLPHALVWDLDLARKVIKAKPRLLSGYSDRVYAVAVAPDGKALASGMNRTISLWRLAAARELLTLEGHTDRVFTVAFSPDGKLLASGGGNADRTIKLWNVATGHLLDTIPAHSAEVTEVAFSPNGGLLASVGLDRVIHLWDVRAGKLKKGAELARVGPIEQVYALAFSPDGKLLAAGSVGKIQLWDVATGKQRSPLAEPHTWRIFAVAFSPDGKLLAGASQNGVVHLWHIAGSKPGRHLGTPGQAMLTLAFSPDGKVLAGGSDDRTIRLWDPGTGKELRALHGHGHSVKSVTFTADGRFLVSGSGSGIQTGHGDGKVKVWPFGPGGELPEHELCTLVAFSDHTWAVVQPNGRYDASRGGDVSWLHWVVDNEPINLSQLKDRYYTPRLLARLLGVNKEPLGKVNDFTGRKLPPAVQLKAADARTKKLAVQVTDRGGGIGRVQVFVNNKELTADARPAGLGAQAAQAEIVVDLSKAPALQGKDDRVRVVTWNADGSLAGRGMERAVELDLPAAPHKSELYAIVAGVSSYQLSRLDLHFASKDADDVASVLQVGARELFGAEKVHLTLLSSSGKAGAKAPTKDHFRAAFEAARQARPDDILLVFLAGHGVAPADADLYCYLTQESNSLDPKAYDDPKERARSTVTSEELVEWIKQVPALKQVMVLDTCAAGAAAAKLTERRDVSAGQIRAIERLKDRTGFHVLMGCAADRVSYEASQFQQGLLTYALLEGMQRLSAKDAQGSVNVKALFDHAWERVPELAHDIGGIQQPVISSPQGAPFVIARLNAADRAGIKLPHARPQLLRPHLTNPAVDDDDLGLQARLRKRLTELSGAGAARGRPVAVYVDADDMHGAFRLAGRYSVRGDEVVVSLRLRRNGKDVEELPPIKGVKGDLDQLVNAIAAAVTERIGRLE